MHRCAIVVALVLTVACKQRSEEEVSDEVQPMTSAAKRAPAAEQAPAAAPAAAIPKPVVNPLVGDDVTYPIDVRATRPATNVRALDTDITCAGEPPGFVPSIDVESTYRAVRAGENAGTVVLEVVKACKQDDGGAGYAIVPVETDVDGFVPADETHPCRRFAAYKKAFGDRLPDHPGACALLEIERLDEPLFPKAKVVFGVRKKTLEAPENVRRLEEGYLVDGTFLAHPFVEVELVATEGDHTLVGESFSGEGATEGVRVHLITSAPPKIDKIFERSWGGEMEGAPYVLQAGAKGRMEVVSNQTTCRWVPAERSFACHEEN